MHRAVAFNNEVRIAVDGREYVIPSGAEVKGTGGFAEVRVARDVTRGVDVAVKIIQLRPVGKTDEKTVQREVRIMRQANSELHPNVLKVLDLHVARGGEADITRNSPIGPAGTCYVFLELCSGGELFDRLTDFGRVPEVNASDYMRGLLEGVRHLHNRGVIHRDIKLENVLLSADGVVKVADFGLAAELAVDDAGAPINMNAILRDVVGSQSYVAPEVLRRNGKGYMGPPADAWSCGVCLFTLLSGFFPLDVADSRDWRFRRLAAEQAQGRFTTCKSIFSMYQRPCPFSQEVQDVLDGLLRVDPQQRMTIDGALQAPFICTRPEEYLEVDADGDADADADGAVVYRTHFMPEPTPLAQPLASSMPVPMRQRAHKSSALAAFTGDGVSDTASRRHWFTMAAIGAGAILTVSGIAGRTRCAAA
eukprot:CAMPEP_0206042218 /NCGR_PEP_ID=MMETSP1466-20131121/6418_1 /ASSEMBLY_ACC=CAM_ASM_001126 /TAXON_ID=44452 /ORGANISM="Pavlova gyrans, Strain CCMP608" /LENGTH=420 /DNA_ID=CAMNT_0053416927 /DNA_START=97 /DNA_END=1359 /DNA_ORIENTATION=+